MECQPELPDEVGEGIVRGQWADAVGTTRPIFHYIKKIE